MTYETRDSLSNINVNGFWRPCYITETGYTAADYAFKYEDGVLSGVLSNGVLQEWTRQDISDFDFIVHSINDMSPGSVFFKKIG